MNSKIYITTSVLWSIYYSYDFFTNVYILCRRRTCRYQYAISEKMSPKLTYYSVDFLTKLYTFHIGEVYTDIYRLSIRLYNLSKFFCCPSIIIRGNFHLLKYPRERFDTFFKNLIPGKYHCILNNMLAT